MRLHCPHCEGLMPGVTITSAQLGTRYVEPVTCPHCGARHEVHVNLTLFTITDGSVKPTEPEDELPPGIKSARAQRAARINP